MRTISALLLTSFLALPVSAQDIDFLSIEFGEVSVGKYSQVQVGINAPKDKPLTIHELSLAGEMFAATTDCTTTVDAGKYCAINIYFEPKIKGDHYGVLGIKTSEGNTLLRLYGTGVQ